MLKTIDRSKQQRSSYCIYPIRLVSFVLLVSSVAPLFISFLLTGDVCRGQLGISSVSAVLSLGLLLSYPQQKLTQFFIWYWHITLAYVLVISNVLTYFLNGFGHSQSIVGQLSLLQLIFGLLLLVLLVSPTTFLALSAASLLGSLLACLLFFTTLEASQHYTAWGFILCGYLLSMVIGWFLSYRKQQEIAYVHAFCSIIGRELRHHVSNALGIAKGHASIAVTCMQHLQTKEEQEDGKVHLIMEPHVYKNFEDSLTDLQHAHDRGQTLLHYYMDMLRASIDRKSFVQCDVAPCVEEAMVAHEVLNEIQRPSLTIHSDFSFFGSHKHLKRTLLALFAYGSSHQQEDARGEVWVGDNMIKYSYLTQAKYYKAWYGFRYPSVPTQHRVTSYIGGGINALYYVRKVADAFGVKLFFRVDRVGEDYQACFSLLFPTVD